MSMTPLNCTAQGKWAGEVFKMLLLPVFLTELYELLT